MWIERLKALLRRRRTFAVAAGILLAAAGVTVYLRMNKPDWPAEVTIAELEKREGRLYLRGESRPYSGLLVEDYVGEGAGRKSELEIRDGRIHGRGRGWHENGQLEVEEHFVDGVSHGTRTRWYANGSRRSEAAIVGGALNGPYREWHENGTLAVAMNMVSGKPDGLVEAWHPDGSPKSRVMMKEGEILNREFFPAGEVASSAPENSGL